MLSELDKSPIPVKPVDLIKPKGAERHHDQLARGHGKERVNFLGLCRVHGVAVNFLVQT